MGPCCPERTRPHKLLAVSCGGGVVTKPVCSFGRKDRDYITLEHPLATTVKWHRSSGEAVSLSCTGTASRAVPTAAERTTFSAQKVKATVVT